ncbi:hypothetical protein [Vibrio nigripulchritudo]|uniref:hypothetical protein n=1 Tax=Vibrio nigripulchritudo TaxID=28173 RepID=UPI000571163D|nr:hypothetical protein [Vibrio nigripulchritudo]
MKDPVFSFSTPRNHQTISHQDERDFAIRLTANAHAATHYLSQLPTSSSQRMQAAARSLSDSFQNLRSLAQLQIQFASLIQFHREVHDERYRTSFDDIDDAITSATPSMLSPTEQSLLWDNLIHRLWVEYSQVTIEHILAILSCDHFLRVHRDVRGDDSLEEAQIHRRLTLAKNARAVISAIVDNRVSTEPDFGLTTVQHRLLENIHKRNIRADKLVQTRQLKDQIRREVKRIGRARSQSQIATPTSITSSASTTPAATATSAISDLDTVITPIQAFRSAVISLDDLTLNLSSSQTRTFQRLSTDSADAHELLSMVEEESKDAELALADEDDDEIEQESTILVMGTEIAVEERIPNRAVMAGISEEEGESQLHVTYFREQGDPMLSNAEAQINGRTLRGEPMPERVGGFQTFRFDLPDSSHQPVNVDLHLTTADSQTATIMPTMLVSQLQTGSTTLPWVPEGLDELGTPPPTLFGVNQIGMVDFYRVEQELACIEAGEPSRTENLLAREYKERTTRRLDVTEVETEATSESAYEQQSDLESTTRHEISSAVEEVLEQDSSRNINVNAGVSGGPKYLQFYANTAMTFATSRSRQESRSQALQYAQSVTERVQQKIMSKTTSKRRELRQHQYEEITKHGLDNRAGEDHVFGIYRWLDKIYRHRLVHVGQRALIEFSIPEPAKRFIQAQELAVPEDDFTKRAPKKPKRFGVKVPNDVTRDNYRKLAARYGISIEAPPPHQINLMRGYSESKPPLAEPIDLNNKPYEDVLSSTYEIEIPENYAAFLVKVAARAAPSYHDAIRHARVDESKQAIPLIPGFYVTVGTESIPDDNSPYSEIRVNRYLEPSISAMLPVSVILPWYHRSFSCHLEVHCRLRRRIYREWQLRAFNDIMDAYREQKAQYDEEKERHEAQLGSANTNPRFKNEIIQKELRQLAMYMIQEPFNIKVAKNHYIEREGKLPKLRLSDKLDKHSEMVRFFEQAFDWDDMAYHLYPYYYAKKRDWTAKLSAQVTKNRKFNAFITSGMARVVVPLRPGFEDAVTYYLQTGQVWFGQGLVMDSENDLYLSIAQEVSQAEETTITETWDTKVPTNLTIVQDQAAAMVGNGLPCIDGEGIGQGDSRLAPLPASNDDSEV